ncbi:hypothetical protein RJ639_011325 [Escallonia herrerae]|uniref:K-box domain-containing protein n=1 Tax=Escallonia herrerae TaxID=1293975 RepID=A0AA88VM51_9ASTE|nr:hypothetical protein RJ639_011325 [Escallonia herrerae]
MERRSATEHGGRRNDRRRRDEGLRMLKTLERYQNCSYGTLEVSRSAKDVEQSSYREYLKVKAKYESLQRYQRQLLGEDLGPFNIKELDHLEHQLDASLKQVRSTKTQSLVDQLSDLQSKAVVLPQEKYLLDANRTLERKILNVSDQKNTQGRDVDSKNSKAVLEVRGIYMDIHSMTILFYVGQLDEIYAENHLQRSWVGGEQSTSYGHNQAQSQGFFQPLDCNSNLQIGFNPVGSSQMTAASDAQTVNGLLPGWML